jgi:hypothetical protein
MRYPTGTVIGDLGGSPSCLGYPFYEVEKGFYELWEVAHLG